MKNAFAAAVVAVGVGVVVAVTSCSPDRIPGAPITNSDHGVAFHADNFSSSCTAPIGSSSASAASSASSAASAGASDVTPPTINLTISPTTLWPPNHKLVKVATGVTATDNCDPAPTLTITVTSNQPSNGAGSGNTSVDYQVVGSGSGPYDIYVRSERDGNSDAARVYTILAVATDASGNSATAGGTVTVPHNK